MNMKYGGRYWFHCERCFKEAHRDPESVAPMPKYWMETQVTLKSGLTYKAVVCEDCQDPWTWSS